jgi:hypothetical protein
MIIDISEVAGGVAPALRLLASLVYVLTGVSLVVFFLGVPSDAVLMHKNKDHPSPRLIR